MKKALVFVLLLVIFCAPLSFAASDKVCAAANSDRYFQAAGGKLARGVANTLFGWIELFRQPAINENAWEGVGKGIVQAIARTGSGVLEIVTFVVPQAKIPLPNPNCPLEMLASVQKTSTSTASGS